MRLFTLLISLFFVLSASAGEDISDPGKLKEIFTNKTAKGVFLTKDLSFNVFFAPDGKLERVTDDGDKHTGTWRITDDGKHCVHFSHQDSENCQVIRTGNRDGVYIRMKEIRNGKLIKLIRLKRFRDGNKLPKE